MELKTIFDRERKMGQSRWTGRDLIIVTQASREKEKNKKNIEMSRVHCVSNVNCSFLFRLLKIIVLGIGKRSQKTPQLSPE